MKRKIVTLVALLMVGVAVQMIWSQAVAPEVETSIAMQKFTNPSTEIDTASRLWSSSDRIKDAFVLFWVAYVVFGLAWMRKDLLSLWKKATETNQPPF